jgi:hypothetical protein
MEKSELSIIREQSSELLMQVGYLECFSSEQGLALFGVLMELMGNVLVLIATGKQNLAHLLLKDCAHDYPNFFKDEKDRTILRRALQELALLIDLETETVH